jgi:CBS domain-containing protein
MQVQKLHFALFPALEFERTTHGREVCIVAIGVVTRRPTMTRSNEYPGPGGSRTTLRRVQRDPDPLGTTFGLYCPRTASPVDLEHCGACEFGRGLSFDAPDTEIYLSCGFERTSSSAPECNPAPYTPVSSITKGPPLLVNWESTVASLTELFVQHADDAAFAVDARGHPVGIVTKSAAWHELYGAQNAMNDGLLCRGAAGSRVKHIMAPLGFTLHPDDDVSDAAALMAYERITHVAVSFGENRVLGILSTFDVLRWLAQQRLQQRAQ